MKHIDDIFWFIVILIMVVGCVVIIGNRNTVDTDPKIESDQGLIDIQKDSIK